MKILPLIILAILAIGGDLLSTKKMTDNQILGGVVLGILLLVGFFALLRLLTKYTDHR